MFQRRREARALAERQQQAVAGLRELVARLPNEEGVITPDGFRQFIDFVSSHNIDLSTVPDTAAAVRLGLAQGGFFLETDTTLLLKKDEAALLEVPATLLKEVADREFRGGSQGVSIPLGGGFRYRVGAYRGHMETIGTHWQPSDDGRLTVTDKRIVYHGTRKTIEFPFSKLASLDAYRDAIDLGVTSRQATSSFAVGDSELVSGIIHAAINHQDDCTVIHIEFTD